jgi:hypothetical protein
MSDPEIPTNRWHPLSVKEVLNLFADAPFQWALAGGYAIEQFLRGSIRDHGDIDIIVFRDEQQHLHDWLHDWHLYAADPPGSLRAWNKGEYLPIEIHDIWLHRAGTDAWQLQLMLVEVETDEWFFRRNRAIRGKRRDLIISYDSIPCIRPEIQLMYKARQPRQKDERDFQACLPLLTAEARHWLSTSISRMFPEGHPWLQHLG